MKKHLFLLLIYIFIPVKMMAQTDLIFKKTNATIAFTDLNCRKTALLLQKNLNKITPLSFEITNSEIESGINLEISPQQNQEYFEVVSDTNKITIKASSALYLEYGATTLLEFWEIRKFTPEYTYYPKIEILKFPKNKTIRQQPNFAFRGLLYPGVYDEAFRKWHKLDWYLNDFGLWGHTFYKLVPAKKYFEKSPKMFALYNHKRNSESICYSNDTVFKVMREHIALAIAENPNATYFSVSQNDDVVYCECPDCQKLNQQYGSPQGAHYYFLNAIAQAFPKTKIVTLAYLFSYQPPKNLVLAPNLYPMFCPIEANRAEPLNEGRNKSIGTTLKKWTALSDNVMVWDYTVQFSNYLSPFPNFQTFAPNNDLYKSSGVKGVFYQGYADVPGSFSELRQYLFAKLLWDNSIDIKKITSDFLRGYYGKAAPFVAQYLEALTANQIKTHSYLDIYSGPVAERNSFLSPQDINTYDILLSKAVAANNDESIQKRILKLRLDLEYVFFEQAKFYGKETHGMFEKVGTKFIVKKNLEQRVRDFVANCNALGIYELSEGGLSPDQYLEQWLFIANNTVIDHLGEHIELKFITQPSLEFNAKKEKGLQDGIKGYKDFTFNWTGWYDNNAEIEINFKNGTFNSLSFQCLEDQRHWIFLPKTIQIWGLKNNTWTMLEEQQTPELTENYHITTKNYHFNSILFCKFDKVKLILIQNKKVPSWRERKNKKPMVMIDELILQKK